MCLLNCQAKHFKGFESCKRVGSWALCSVQVWFTLAAQQPVRNGPRLFSLVSEANQKCSWWGLFKSDVNSNIFLEMSGNVLFMWNVSNCSEIVLEAQRACRRFRKTRISSCLCFFFFKVYLVCILSNPTKLCRVTVFACLKRFSSTKCWCGNAYSSRNVLFTLSCYHFNEHPEPEADTISQRPLMFSRVCP